MNFCRACHAELPENAKFCPQCGAKSHAHAARSACGPRGYAVLLLISAGLWVFGTALQAHLAGTKPTVAYQPPADAAGPDAARLRAEVDRNPADLTALKSAPQRGLYGEKALVSPALVDLLLRELGATRLVTVPQDVTIGHVLRKLRK